MLPPPSCLSRYALGREIGGGQLYPVLDAHPVKILGGEVRKPPGGKYNPLCLRAAQAVKGLF